jgi:membrane fusion protein, heavy metal efflux system
MKQIGSTRGVALSLALAAGLSLPVGALLGCKQVDQEQTSAPTQDHRVVLSAAALKNARLSTARAGDATLRPTVTFQGDIVLTRAQKAKVVARVSGIVGRISKQEGDAITKGELLVVMQSRELGQAVLAYLESKHRHAFAVGALQREQVLHKQGIGSKEDYLKRRHGLEEAAFALTTARQRLQVLGVPPRRLASFSLRSSRNASRHELRAPLSGTVTRRSVTSGQAVRVGDELFEVADLSRLHVAFPVRAEQLGHLKQGMKVSIKLCKLALSTEGTLDHIAPTVNPGSRTVRARAVFDNKGGVFRAGLCAAVTLTASALKVPLAVPVAALHELGGKSAVFIARGAGAFEARFVQRGHADGSMVEIRDGLAAGETVVTKNSLVLKSAWAQGAE